MYVSSYCSVFVCIWVSLDYFWAAKRGVVFGPTPVFGKDDTQLSIIRILPSGEASCSNCFMLMNEYNVPLFFLVAPLSLFLCLSVFVCLCVCVRDTDDDTNFDGRMRGRN